ncbi:hypothetical protein [Kosmotoga sp.]|uniref:hypothetical protein n=1 Tax=Kosmotoga sp. TaxID=1955248 RepID=UPI0024AB310F|nr:hypothetical protein [Kosmotoga sp.]MDI3523670.1 hypothetical protein [Kosmotoga sp.]MDK2954334.1 hypothetical protein [Kosmotoga sp.]
MFAIDIKCPYCQRSLMNTTEVIDKHPSIQLEVVHEKHHGIIWLSSVYGSYNYKITFNIPDGVTAKFFCPHCSEELLGELECAECGEKMVRLMLEAGGYVHFCPRKGCKGHYIEYNESETLIDEAYKHYPYIDSEE